MQFEVRLFQNAWLIIHNMLYIVNTFFTFILIFFCFVFTLILETPEFYDRLKLIRSEPT